MASPTARSMKWLREQGYSVCSVEKWIPGANIRRDAFGFGDALVCGWENGNPNAPVIALVQFTSYTNMRARIKKILALPESLKWLRSGGQIWVHAWKKRRPRGMPRSIWLLTERKIDSSSFHKEVVNDQEGEVEVQKSPQQESNREASAQTTARFFARDGATRDTRT